MQDVCFDIVDRTSTATLHAIVATFVGEAKRAREPACTM